MKRFISLFCIAMMLLCVIPANAARRPDYTTDNEWDVLKLVNDEREKEGLLPLTTFGALEEAARLRAKETDTLFSHTRPDGTSCFTVLDQKNIWYTYAGENIAEGQFTAEEVMDSWMNSEGHRKNILSGYFKHVGVGYYKGTDKPTNGSILYGHCWTQLFAGGCTTTSIAVEGIAEKDNFEDAMLKVTCDKHGDSYMPLENADVTYKDGVYTAKYDGKTVNFDVKSSTGITDTSKIFSDIPQNAWYKQHVDYVYTYGIFGGKTQNSFAPNDNITRAEFVQVLANLSKIDTTNKNVSTKFSDVKPGAWYAPAVKWASDNGIVSGKSANSFDPNAKITREEMCVMLVNYASFKGITLEKKEAKINFADDSMISSWAKERVYMCQIADLVNGKGGNKFDPKASAIRAEAATLFRGFHEKYISQ